MCATEGLRRLCASRLISSCPLLEGLPCAGPSAATIDSLPIRLAGDRGLSWKSLTLGQQAFAFVQGGNSHYLSEWKEHLRDVFGTSDAALPKPVLPEGESRLLVLGGAGSCSTNC